MQEIWDRIEVWLKVYTPEVLANLNEGATEDEAQRLEDALCYTLPEDVKSSLRIHDGTAENYMSFTDLLFFADAGNGDRFAFPIIQGKVRVGRTYAWDHEDDTRKVVAFSLKSFLERWLSGKIKL